MTTEPRGRRKGNAPWKHTDNDRGYMRRKMAADARAAEHVCGPTCKRYRTGKIKAAVGAVALAALMALPVQASRPTAKPCNPGHPCPTATPTATATPTPSPTGTPAPPGPMWVGVDVGKWGADRAPDIKGSVNYVTLDTPSSSLVAGYNNAGLAVVDVIVGPYNSGGVSALDPNAWAANAVATFRASPSIVAIEILNEPGGSWFWGSNALSQQNATAYANLLRIVHDAFVANGSRPKLLASYDGGYSGGRTWGQEVWAADPNVGTYIDGIVMHPYGGTASVSASALGNRANVAAAEAETGLPVYITEVGWPTAVGQPATGDSLQWSEADQATNIYNFVGWARSTGYIKAVLIFDYVDYGSNFWYGIERANPLFSHKKSYEDLRRAGLGLPQS